MYVHAVTCILAYMLSHPSTTYIHIYVYTCRIKQKYIHTRSQANTHIHMYSGILSRLVFLILKMIYSHKHIHTGTCMHVCLYKYVYTYIHAHTCIETIHETLYALQHCCKCLIIIPVFIPI